VLEAEKRSWFEVITKRAARGGYSPGTEEQEVSSQIEDICTELSLQIDNFYSHGKTLLDHVAHAFPAFFGGARSCTLKSHDSFLKSYERYVSAKRLVMPGGFAGLSIRSSSALAAENLFLRKQLALYVERKKRVRRASNSIRFTLAQLARFFDWRNALTIVKPDTLVRWHRKRFRLFWKWKSRSAGPPKIGVDLRKLIAEMATNNPTWDEERIADELLLKIGIQISPRTVRRYIPKEPTRSSAPTQRWTIRAKSCNGEHSCRLLYRSHFDISIGLRTRNHGSRNAADTSCERDAASDGRVDITTIPRVCCGRRRIQVHHSRS
jgi:hypothetical protein